MKLSSWISVIQGLSSCVSLGHSYLEPQSGNTATKQTKHTEADKTAAGGKATHAVSDKEREWVHHIYDPLSLCCLILFSCVWWLLLDRRWARLNPLLRLKQNHCHRGVVKLELLIVLEQRQCVPDLEPKGFFTSSAKASSF